MGHASRGNLPVGAALSNSVGAALHNCSLAAARLVWAQDWHGPA